MGGLRLGDQVQCGRRGDGRELGVQGRRRLAQLAPRPGQSCAVIRGQRLMQGGSRQGGFGAAVPDPGFGPDHPPAPGAEVAAFKVKVDDADMAGRMARHHRWLARKSPGHRINLGRGGEVRPRKHLMAVTGDNRVDLGQGGKGGGGVLGPVLGVQRADPGMGQRHDDIGPLGAQAGKPGPGRRQDVTGAHTAAGGIAVPCLDLRRGKADHADADQMAAPGMVDDLAAQDGEGRHQRLVPGRAFPQPAGQIGRDDGKARILKRLGQKAQPVVEFVVAQRDRVIAQRVERGDDRMGAPSFGRGGEIRDRAALQEIAVVEQKAVLRLAPRFGDLLRHRAKAKVRIGPVRAVVVGHEAGVKVTGRDDPQRSNSAGPGQRAWSNALIILHRLVAIRGQM